VDGGSRTLGSGPAGDRQSKACDVSRGAGKPCECQDEDRGQQPAENGCDVEPPFHDDSDVSRRVGIPGVSLVKRYKGNHGVDRVEDGVEAADLPVAARIRARGGVGALRLQRPRRREDRAGGCGGAHRRSCAWYLQRDRDEDEQDDYQPQNAGRPVPIAHAEAVGSVESAARRGAPPGDCCSRVSALGDQDRFGSVAVAVLAEDAGGLLIRTCVIGDLPPEPCAACVMVPGLRAPARLPSLERGTWKVAGESMLVDDVLALEVSGDQSESFEHNAAVLTARVKCFPFGDLLDRKPQKVKPRRCRPRDTSA
jgi:hypothetical protein